jgi:adenylate cyclase, class 2
MGSNQEIEIKFRVANLAGLARKLRRVGFRVVTKRTLEMNTLVRPSRRSAAETAGIAAVAPLRLEWTLTHKAGQKTGRHSSREELETSVGDGKQMDLILRALGYAPSFRYEKFRAEWTDGKGQVVVDETPIGDFCEIEGAPRWIDATAKKLGVSEGDYITKNYASLFLDWKARTSSSAEEMTFKAACLGRLDQGVQVERRSKLRGTS